MTEPDQSEAAPPRRIPLLAFAWLWVAAPFVYGLDRLLVNLLKLFH
ncbi:hypothetical protein OG874_08180 [Nocardia sp. NBC_00565]|nr:hypothetical protein [Nocardia sp. NBC_00565]WUC05114.1 hypothetical protein OG874_08180 [Nocardia sp. NBC_00565]